MWGVSAQLLRTMELCRTPLSMQRCLNGAIKAVCHAYSLSFPGKETQKKSDQDYRISALLMVLFQAQLKRPFSIYKYIETCCYRIEEHGEDEFNWVTLYSCLTFLIELDSQRLKMSSEEFQSRILSREKSADNFILTFEECK